MRIYRRVDTCGNADRESIPRIGVGLCHGTVQLMSHLVGEGMKCHPVVV